jgi:hypothetical protein
VSLCGAMRMTASKQHTVKYGCLRAVSQAHCSAVGHTQVLLMHYLGEVSMITLQTVGTFRQFLRWTAASL